MATRSLGGFLAAESQPALIALLPQPEALVGARGPCGLVLWRPTPAWEGSQHLAQALVGRASLQL